LLSSLVLSITSPADAGYSFTPLGDLPGGEFSSHANAVSADGSVVVGESVTSPNGYTEAFRWTAATGMVSLGKLSESDRFSRATAVSHDGSIVAGFSGRLGLSIKSFRWTNESSLQEIPNSRWRMTADGTIVEIEPGWETIGAPPPFDLFSYSRVSLDGSVVIGIAPGTIPSDYSLSAVRWTATDGFENLGDLPGGEPYAAATSLSMDGSIIVGQSSSANGFEAFRWTDDEGMVGLGLLPGSFASAAKDLSTDGNMIVGTSYSATGNDVFVWTHSEGMQSLRELLANNGVDLEGWQFEEARGISADGHFIIGSGINPAGNREAWLASITVPEASTFILAAMGCSGLLVVMRRRNRDANCIGFLANGQFAGVSSADASGRQALGPPLRKGVRF
jgi:probable HAF family extracellular repeat protein